MKLYNRLVDRFASRVFGCVLLLAATGAFTPGSAPAQQAPLAEGLDPATRSEIDTQLFKAKGVRAYLQVAHRYAVAGYPQQAKVVVNRAASEAGTPGEWRAVAEAYRRLRYPENAAMAERKARDVAR